MRMYRGIGMASRTQAGRAKSGDRVKWQRKESKLPETSFPKIGKQIFKGFPPRRMHGLELGITFTAGKRSGYYLKCVSIFLPEDDVGTPHDPRRAPVKDKSNYSVCRTSSDNTNGDIKRRTQYMVSYERYLKKHEFDADPTNIMKGGGGKGFRQNTLTLDLLASSIIGWAMGFIRRFRTAMRVTFGVTSRDKCPLLGKEMTLSRVVYPRGAQKGEASPWGHQTSDVGVLCLNGGKVKVRFSRLYAPISTRGNTIKIDFER